MAPSSFMGEHARKYYNNLLPHGPPVWIDPTLHYSPSYFRNAYLPLDSRQQQQLLLRPPPLPTLPRCPPLPSVVYPAHRIPPARDYIPPSRTLPDTRPDSTPSFSSTSETTHNQPSAQPDPVETRPQSAELEANQGKRSRITFTPYQLMVLEEEFAFRSYLTRVQRSRLAYKLNLTDKQVKIWFQNRRTKQKKEEAEAQQLAQEVSTKVSLKAPQEAPPKVTQEGLPSIPLTQEVPTKASQEVPRKAHPKVTQEALPSNPLTQEVPTKFSREVLQEALQRIPREVYHELPRKVPQKISQETNCTTRRLLCDNVVHCACCRAGYKGL